MQSHIKQLDQQWILSAPDLAITTDWFDSCYWQAQGQMLGQSRGRNITWFVGEKDAPMVLRHYYRGGLIGKLIEDIYFYTGLKSTRAYREYQLLLELEKRQLPACRVVAARVVRHGLYCRADLLMKMVAGGQDLVALLTKAPFSESQWQAIGRMIAKFHQQCVYHADLNAHNILLDGDGQPCLIDFDRGEIKEAKGDWCQDNLDRLLRSFNKEKAQLDNFHFELNDWQSLMSGYAQSKDK